MQNQSVQLLAVDAPPAKRLLPFKIVAVYDTALSLMQAKAIRCRLAAELRNEVEVQSSFWYHALLGHPQLRAQAANEASRADMIVVSVSDSLGITEAFTEWLQKSVGSKAPGSAALVLLLDHKRGLEGGSDLTAFLRQTAEEHGLDFFARSDYKRPDITQIVLPARRAACGRAAASMRITTPVAASPL